MIERVSVATTILLTVYGQMAVKYAVTRAGTLPEATSDRISYVLRLLLDPFIVSALAAAFLGALSWFVALSRLQLSHAYPFMALSFVGVLIFSWLIFAEPLTVQKVSGIALIVAGVIVVGFSM